ncbi:hypothetical protein Trydic_g11007 [Trypoxylus dichotomus]
MFYHNTVLLVKRLIEVKRNLFLKNSVANKNPYSIFTNWYKTAAQVCNADSMYLTTVSKTCMPSCKVTTCLRFSRNGFIFLVTSSSQACMDLKDNCHAAMTFNWPRNRVVRIEGSTKLSEDNEFYIPKLSYSGKILAACGKFQKSFKNRQSLLKCLNNIKDKFSQNSNIPCNISVFILKPSRIEFYQSKSELQERVQFNKDTEVDNKFVYEAEDGWSYSILSP